MEFLISVTTYNSSGGFSVFSFVDALLTLELGDYSLRQAFNV